MQPVYKVDWDSGQVKFERRIGAGVCSWSRNNWIAFTTGYACRFEQSGQGFTEQLHSDVLFIVDPDHPWNVYCLKTAHLSQILHVSWDPTGLLRLVTADEEGVCKIWCSVDDCINKWICQHTVNLGENDSIVQLCWLGSSSKSVIDLAQVGRTKDLFTKFPPKQSLLSADPFFSYQDAFACVTTGGVFHIVSLFSSSTPIVTSAWLGNIRLHVFKADMMLTDASKVSIAVISDTTCVDLFIASIKMQSFKLEVTIDVWPCIVPYPVVDGGEAVQYAVKDVRYILKSSGDQLLVVTDSNACTSLHHFELKKEPILLHARFRKGQQNQQNQSADSCLCLKTVNLPKVVCLVALSQLPVINYNKGNDFSMSQKAVFLDDELVLRTYSLQSWAQVGKANISLATGDNISLDWATLSPADQALFAITNKGTCIFGILQHFDMFPEKMRLQCVCTLLEYCMVEKQLAWDVALYLKSQSKFVSEQAMSLLDESFCEMSAPIQEHFATSYLQSKSILLKSSGDYVGFIECTYMLTLRNIYLFVMTLMRSEKEVFVLDAIQALHASSREFDISKASSLLDTKDATFVDVADASAAALFQWVVDYILHLVRLIRSGDPAQSLKQLLSYVMKSTFQELRDLLIIMLLIFQKSSSFAIHPVYMSTVTMQDFLQQLYSFTSKLYCLFVGEQNVEFGHNDLVFSSLPLMYLPLPSRDPSGSVLSQQISMQKSIEHYEFQITQSDWDTLKQISLQNPLTAGVITVSTGPRHMYDAVNLMPCSLVAGEGVRQCAQCGALTFSSAKSSRSFNQAWRNCWAMTCLCGGLWQEVKWSDT